MVLGRNGTADCGRLRVVGAEIVLSVAVPAFVFIDVVRAVGVAAAAVITECVARTAFDTGEQILYCAIACSLLADPQCC